MLCSLDGLPSKLTHELLALQASNGVQVTTPTGQELLAQHFRVEISRGNLPVVKHEWTTIPKPKSVQSWGEKIAQPPDEIFKNGRRTYDFCEVCLDRLVSPNNKY